MSKCPFDDPRYYLDINEPCPVCGMLGTVDAKVKCIDNPETNDGEDDN